MRRFAPSLAALAAIPLACAPAPAAASSAIQAATPAGFDELERPHQVLVDIYYGGRKVGEAMAVASPGKLRFVDPARILGLIPDVIPSPQLAAALSGELPTHSELACSAGNPEKCGELSPDTAGIIFDEDRFRATLFLSPRFLRPVRPTDQAYLPSPTSPLSLTSSTGLAVSGSAAGPASYNLQNRTIVSLRNARLRSDFSYASHFGIVADDLVAEVDRRDLRYSAGLFWAPGLDLTGQRRIAGIGLGTQFDTRADRDTLEGTPIVLFLQQPSRVEMIVDGRLVTSRAYGAGNVVIDTSELPDGSYPLVLRVRGQDGRERDERRFFVKNAQIAPVGQPLYFAYAGLLANTRPDRPISLSDSFYYQLGTARRLSRSLALDLSAVGADGKNVVEAGGWLVTRYGRVRLAGLISTTGDRATLLQLGSSGLGRLSLNLDVRRVWSSDERPLIPLSAPADNFGTTAPTGAQTGSGSYTQMTGSIGYTLGSAYLSVIGSFRRDHGLGSDYTLGPSLNWPLVSKNGFQLLLQADAQRTRVTTAGFLGFRAQLTRNNLSFISTLGHATRRSGDGSLGDADRTTRSLSADYFYEGPDRTQISGSAGFDRNLDSDEVHASGAIYSRLGSARGDLLHPFGGDGGLQYGLTLQTGAAINRHDAALGGRDIDESALLVSLDGEAGDSTFEVLVNGQRRGRVAAGRPLPIFLQPYREYRVRLRPVGATSVDFDSATREITLYPGNVQYLRWDVRRLFTVFGQALRADGRPLANAAVQSGRGIGETDQHGYFQIDVAAGDMLSFAAAGAASCEARIGATAPREEFVALGKVICR